MKDSKTPCLSWKAWKKRHGLSINRDFFPTRTVRHWSRLPGETVQPPSWEGFKTILDKVLRSLVWPQSCPCSEQEVGLETPEAPSNTNSPVILSKAGADSLLPNDSSPPYPRTEAHSHLCSPHIPPDPGHKWLVSSWYWVPRKIGALPVTLCPHHVYGCVKKRLQQKTTTKLFLMKMFLGKLNYSITFPLLIFMSKLFLCISNNFCFLEKNKMCFSLIANIIVRSLSKEQNILKEKFMLCFKLF